MLRCIAGNLTYLDILQAHWSFKMLGNMQSTNVTSKKTYIFCRTTVRSSNKVHYCHTVSSFINLYTVPYTKCPGSCFTELTLTFQDIILFKINVQIEYIHWWHNSWQERELV